MADWREVGLEKVDIKTVRMEPYKVVKGELVTFPIADFGKSEDYARTIREHEIPNLRKRDWGWFSWMEINEPAYETLWGLRVYPEPEMNEYGEVCP